MCTIIHWAWPPQINEDKLLHIIPIWITSNIVLISNHLDLVI